MKDKEFEDVLGKNIQATVIDGIIYLKIDPSKRLGESKSGKSEIVATTSGNVNYAGIKLGINAYLPKTKVSSDE